MATATDVGSCVTRGRHPVFHGPLHYGQEIRLDLRNRHRHHPLVASATSFRTFTTVIVFAFSEWTMTGYA